MDEPGQPLLAPVLESCLARPDVERVPFLAPVVGLEALDEVLHDLVAGGAVLL